MRHDSRFSRLSLFAAILALFAIGFTGCSDDDDDNPLNPGPGSSTFTGTYVNGSEGGQVSISIPLVAADLAPARLAKGALAHDVTATGAFYTEEGDTIGLSGTYNEEANSLVMTGGGYSLAGTYDASHSPQGIAGTYTGPNGTGIFGAAAGTSSSVTVLCGSFSDIGTSFEERWNLIVAGDAVAGVAVMGDGEIIPFEGTLTGVSPGRTLVVADNLGDGRTMIASGTVYENAQISTGQWELDEGTVADPNGFWNAQDCDTPPPAGVQ